VDGEEAPGDADEAGSGAVVAVAVGDAVAVSDGGSEDAVAGVGLGVDDFAGEDTGQVAAADLPVCTGCLVVTAAETLGTGVVETAGAGVASLAGAVEAVGAGVTESVGT
jgi:hypothetical protein